MVDPILIQQLPLAGGVSEEDYVAVGQGPAALRKIRLGALRSYLVPAWARGDKGDNGDKGDKGDKGDAGAGGNVAIGRAQLKTGPAALAAAGDVWRLSEGGRDGSFRMKGGVPPSADPDEALFVVVSATKYFERIVTDGTYDASWWGEANTSATTVAERDRANRMFALLPPFAVLNWWSANIVIKNDVQLKKPVTVRFGGFGVVRDPTSGLQGGPTWNVLVIASPDVTLIDPYVSGQRSQQAAGNPAAIQISSVTTAAPADVRRIKLIRPVIRNCTAGIIIYGDWKNLADRNKTPIKSYPFHYPTDIRIEAPDIECNYMGIENFYGVGVTISNPKIRFFEHNAATGFHPAVRILGATDTLVHDFEFDLLIKDGFWNDGAWGFYIAADNGRQQNVNTTIRDGVVKNCATTFYVDEDLGTLSLKNVETRNPLDSVERRFGLRVSANDAPFGVQTKVGRLIHHGCRYEGVAVPYDLQGYITHTDCRDNTFVGNAYVASDLTAISFTQFGSNQQKKSAEFVNDRFKLNPGPSYRLISGVTQIGAGAFLRFENLLLPEGTTGTNPADTSFMEASPANIATSVVDPGIVNGVVPKGSCGRYPAGAWAARL